MSLKDLLVRARLIEDDQSANESANESTNVSAHGEPRRESGKDLVLEMEPPTGFVPTAVAADEISGIPENTSFDSIYAGFGVASASFPAERLLKVLEGLRAMDASNRRAAIAAMDAADDSWNVADVLADAARKVTALQAHMEKVNAALAGMQEQERSRKTVLVSDYDALRASISEQIAQLQEATQIAATEHAQAIAALEAKTTAAVSAAQREQQRLLAEVERLNGIALQLDSAKS